MPESLVQLNETTPMFRLNNLKPPLAKPAIPAKEPHPALRDYYSPAADLAKSRPPAAGYAAERAQADYVENVGATLPVSPQRFSQATKLAQQAAEQLANRMILAVLEETKKPSAFDADRTVFGPSRESIRSDLVAALGDADRVGSRPVGDRVWGDILRQEYPPEIYQPHVQVIATSDPGVVYYRIDSWLLPSTRTAVHVGDYADKAWANYESVRFIFDPNRRRSSLFSVDPSDPFK